MMPGPIRLNHCEMCGHFFYSPNARICDGCMSTYLRKTGMEQASPQPEVQPDSAPFPTASVKPSGVLLTSEAKPNKSLDLEGSQDYWEKERWRKALP